MNLKSILLRLVITCFLTLACLSNARAQELFRLRFEANVDWSKKTTEIPVYIDNLSYGANTAELCGLCFGIEIPEELELMQAKWSSPVGRLFTSPLFENIVARSNSLRATIIFSGDYSLRLPEGTSQEIIRLKLRRKKTASKTKHSVSPLILPFTPFSQSQHFQQAASAPKYVRLKFSNKVGHSTTPLAFILSDRMVHPHIRSQLYQINPASSAQGHILGSASGGSSSGGLAFPPPSAEENTAIPFGTSSQGGVGNADPTNATGCDLPSPLIDTLPLPDFTVCTSPCSGDYNEIQEALTQIAAMQLNYPINLAVEAGIYQSFTLNEADFPYGITIYSIDGPEYTFITGNQMQRSEIIGSLISNTAVFIRIGLVTDEALQGWHGFTFIDGRNQATEQGGALHIDMPTSSFEFLGNIVGDELSPNISRGSGGGIALIQPKNALIAFNLIQHNQGLGRSHYAIPDAAGLYVEGHEYGGIISIVNNDVISNQLIEPLLVGSNATGTLGGGGIGVYTHRPYVDSTVNICSNNILENLATVGMGIYLHAYTSPFGLPPTITYNVVDNLIARNNISPPQMFYYAGTQIIYEGGGAFVNADGALELNFLNNSIIDNNVSGNTEDPNQNGYSAHNYPEKGGGLSIQGKLSGVNPDEAIRVHGNLFAENTAHYFGGGAYIRLGGPAPFQTKTSFMANTFLENSIEPGGVGAGLCFGPINIPMQFKCSSNILQDNEFDDVQWYSASQYYQSTSEYNQLPQFSQSPLDLFGTGCSESDAMFIIQGLFNIGRISGFSTCIDSAESAITPATLGVTHDIDGEMRFSNHPTIGAPGALLDRGADEWHPSPTTTNHEFIRGNVNPLIDSVVNLTDVILVLRYLFPSGTPIDINCKDAADVDDNEAINLPDVVLLLNYLFRQGTQPSDPFPICGFDAISGTALDCTTPTNCP